MNNPVTELLTREDLIKSERDFKQHLREVQKWANNAEQKLVKKTTRIRELEAENERLCGMLKSADFLLEREEKETERLRGELQRIDATYSKRKILKDAERWRRVAAAFYIFETSGPEYDVADVFDVIREAARGEDV